MSTQPPPPTPNPSTTHPPPTPPLPQYKTQFLTSCLSSNTLTFGTYTLKSGRQSPYFFNAGAFHTGLLLTTIATAYAHTITEFLTSQSLPAPDILFGPAYKGIPLAAATLLELTRLDPAIYATTSYAHNRKENKAHGEGGGIVGCELRGRSVLLVDDVVSAGTAVREAVELVGREGGRVVGVVVALDRGEEGGGMDRGGGKRISAMQQIREDLGVPTASIATLDDVITILRGKGDEGDVQRLEEYRRRWLV